MALLKCMPMAVQGFYIYNWDGIISNTSTLQNLSAGDVSVVVFDANFCQKDTLINLSQPSSCKRSNYCFARGL